MTVRNTGCSYFDFFFTGYTCPRYWEQARGTPVNEHIVIDGENKLKASEECFQRNGLLRWSAWWVFRGDFDIWRGSGGIHLQLRARAQQSAILQDKLSGSIQCSSSLFMRGICAF